MNIGIYQVVNAHAPAIHWWLAQDHRFGPQIYSGLKPTPERLAIGTIVEENRYTHLIDQDLYYSHQETLRMMENKTETDGGIDCLSEYFKFNEDFQYKVWSNYFGATYDSRFAPIADKLIFTQVTTEQSAMFYITQYAFIELTEDEIIEQTQLWWEDHMLMDGDIIGKWKEVWYRDYHDKCIEDFHDGKLKYMWQLNFAHWDLKKSLSHIDDNTGDGIFEFEYSFHRLFEEKHDYEDVFVQNESLSYIEEDKIDHLVVDVEWFKNTDVILDYLGVSNSDILKEAAQIYGRRYKQVVDAYDILYNKYYINGETA